MPTIVDILTFMSRINLCSVEHEKSFITSGPGLVVYGPLNPLLVIILLSAMGMKLLVFSISHQITQLTQYGFTN